MLPALAHVPPVHVKASLELVIEEQFEESVLEKLDKLAIYIETVFLDRNIVFFEKNLEILNWGKSSHVEVQRIKNVFLLLHFK